MDKEQELIWTSDLVEVGAGGIPQQSNKYIKTGENTW
jgi:hypothetical protein